MVVRAKSRHTHSRSCSAPGSLDTSLSHAAGLIEIAACHYPCARMSLESDSSRVFEIRKSYAPTGRIGNAEPATHAGHAAHAGAGVLRDDDPLAILVAILCCVVAQ